MGGPMMGGGAMVGRPGGPGGPMNPQQQMIIPQTRILPGGMVVSYTFFLLFLNWWFYV